MERAVVNAIVRALPGVGSAEVSRVVSTVSRQLDLTYGSVDQDLLLYHSLSRLLSEIRARQSNSNEEV